MFVTKLQSNGAYVWEHGFGKRRHEDVAQSVAVDSAGNALVGEPLTPPAPARSTSAAVPSPSRAIQPAVMRLGANGAHVWDREVGGTGAVGAEGVAVDGEGNALVTGS